MRDLCAGEAPGVLQEFPRQPWKLIDLLHRSRAAKATDPRDRVYALLNLSKDKNSIAARPDYSLTVRQTFIRYAKHMLEAGDGPKLLCNAFLADSKLKMPSWVVDWSLEGLSLQRVVPDPNRTFFNQHTFGAAGGTNFEFKIDKEQEKLQILAYVIDSISHIGNVEESPPLGGEFADTRSCDEDVGTSEMDHFGWVMPPEDDIESVHQAVEMVFFPPQKRGTLAAFRDEPEWFLEIQHVVEGCTFKVSLPQSRKLGAIGPEDAVMSSFWRCTNEAWKIVSKSPLYQSTLESVCNAVWLMMVCGRAPLQQTEASPEGLQDFRAYLHNTRCKSDVSLAVNYAAVLYSLVQNSPTLRHKYPSRGSRIVLVDTLRKENVRRAATFIHSARRFVYDLRAARSSEGYVGMVPHRTEIGDLFCVVKGMDIPVVLRETEKGIYLLVGQAYLHGFMKGEVLSMSEKKAQHIVLV
jgi:hypothetical protein